MLQANNNKNTPEEPDEPAEPEPQEEEPPPPPPSPPKKKDSRVADTVENAPKKPPAHLMKASPKDGPMSKPDTVKPDTVKKPAATGKGKDGPRPPSTPPPPCKQRNRQGW